MHENCLPHSIIVQLIKLAHKLEDAAERLFFAPYGLTMLTGRILMILGRIGQATPTELIALADCTKSNLSQRLTTLEKAGLITHQKRLTERDKRHTTIRLTPKGQTLAKKLMKIFDQQIALFEAGISTEDWQRALNVLNVLNKKVDTSLSLLK